jgi:hypothetical protein
MRQPCKHCGSKYCVCPAGTADLHARIVDLEARLDRHHARMGCINYCSVCGKDFDWKTLDPETAKFVAPTFDTATEPKA